MSGTEEQMADAKDDEHLKQLKRKLRDIEQKNMHALARYRIERDKLNCERAEMELHISEFISEHPILRQQSGFVPRMPQSDTPGLHHCGIGFGSERDGGGYGGYGGTALSGVGGFGPVPASAARLGFRASLSGIDMRARGNQFTAMSNNGLFY